MADGREDDWILSLIHSSSVLFNCSLYVEVSIALPRKQLKLTENQN